MEPGGVVAHCHPQGVFLLWPCPVGTSEKGQEQDLEESTQTVPVDNLIDIHIPQMLEVRGVGRIGSRLESLGSSLGLPERVSMRKPGLEPWVVQVRLGNRGLLWGWTCTSVDVLGWQNVLLSLREGERNGRPLWGDWCVNFEVLFLIGGRVRLH